MRRVTLDSKQTTIMLKMAVKTPAQNFELIMNHGLTVTGLRGSRFIDPNYSRVIPQLLTVNARVRKAPTIACATNVSVRPDASWNLANHRYNQPGQLKSWRWLWLTISGCKPEIQPSSGQKSMQSFADSFKKALALTGIRIGNCQTGMRFNLKSENDSTLEQILRDASKGVELVWIIVPKSIKLLYDRIKLTADVKLGVATVLSRDVKLAESSQAQLNQYLGNEALKVNLKLGGRNQVCSNGVHPSLSWVPKCGIYLTHTRESHGKSRFAFHTDHPRLGRRATSDLLYSRQLHHDRRY